MTGVLIQEPDDAAAADDASRRLFNIDAVLKATYPLYKPGLGTNEDIAKIMVDITKLKNKKSLGDILLSVKKLYFANIGAGYYSRLMEQMKNNYAKRLVSIKALVASGDKPILEQSMAEVGLAQAELDYKKSLNNKRSVQSDFKIILGLPDNSEDIITEDFPGIPVVKYSIDDISSLIQRYNPEMQIAHFASEIARIEIQGVQLKHLPTVGLTGVAGFAYNKFDYKKNGIDGLKNTNNWGPEMGFTLTAILPIYNGGSINAQTDIKIADYNKSQIIEKKSYLSLMRDARTNYELLNELLERIQIAKFNIKNAALNLLLAQKSYDSGIVDLTVVQNAELSMFNTEKTLIDSQVGYFQTLSVLANIVGVEEKELCRE